MGAIEYDGYEFENPVDRAKIERLADICSISARMAAAKYLPFPECIGELNSCLCELIALRGPLFQKTEKNVACDYVMCALEAMVK